MNIEMGEEMQDTSDSSLHESNLSLPLAESRYKTTMKKIFKSICKCCKSFKINFAKLLLKYANVLFIIHNIVCLHLFINLERKQELKKNPR